MAELSRLPGPVADLWDWQLEGACRRVGPDVFFHPEGERGDEQEDTGHREHADDHVEADIGRGLRLAGEVDDDRSRSHTSREHIDDRGRENESGEAVLGGVAVEAADSEHLAGLTVGVQQATTGATFAVNTMLVAVR